MTISYPNIGEINFSLEDAAVTGDIGKEQFTCLGEKLYPSHYVDGIRIAENIDEPLIDYESLMDYFLLWIW